MANTETEKVANGAKHVGQAIKDGADRTKEIASTVGGSIRDLGDAARKAGSAALHEASNAASSAYQTAKDAAVKTYEQVSETGAEGVKMLEKEIKTYPFTALISAFSLGAIMGMMCRRSN